MHVDGTGQERCLSEFIVLVGLRVLGLKFN